jgi:pyrroloquinoline quinone (PQQ) biosynthesis protein C
MTEFFTRLQQETESERAALIQIPFIQYGVKGQISLSSYRAFLTQAYHHVKHTTPLLMACGSRIASSKEWLRDAMAHYIEEEVGHQEWILNDLQACGADAESIRNSQPGHAADVMCAYAYHVVERMNPVGFLGMVLVLEGTSINLASTAAANIQKTLNLPDHAFSYLTSHGAIDVSHMEFYKNLVNRLQDVKDQLAVIQGAKRFYRLYGDVFRDLPLELDLQAQAA